MNLKSFGREMSEMFMVFRKNGRRLFAWSWQHWQRGITVITTMMLSGHLLLIFFSTVVAFEHMCTEKETRLYMEKILHRDISYVMHEDDGGCTVKYVDNNR